MAFPYALVLFDLDGTLIDTASDIAEAVNRTLDDWHLPRVEEAVIRGWIGDGARKLVETAFAHAGSDAAVEAVMPGFMGHYGDTLLLRARLYPGVRDTLQALHDAGVATALCTNKPERFLAPLLDKLGIASWLAARVGGDTLAERKPSAAPLLRLAAQFGCAADACVMVGDSETDLRAAQAAGIDAVLVDYGYARGFDLHAAGARAVIGDLRELLAIA